MRVDSIGLFTFAPPHFGNDGVRGTEFGFLS